MGVLRWTLMLALLGLAGCGSNPGPLAPDPVGRTAGVSPASRTLVGLPKSVDVFGVKLYASAAVPDDKLLHAARVMAEYLDNDEDGAPDDPVLVGAMVAASAYLVMFADEADEQASSSALPAGQGQNLYARETHPESSLPGVFDATLEEVLHLISHAGLASVYSGTLGEQPGSELTLAMDVARGGAFLTIPSSYPAGAWYTYSDATCSYDCQATEYFYWALTSILGGQQYPGRLDEIQDEWRLDTPAAVAAGDPAVHALLTDGRHRLPRVLPDGLYTAVPIVLIR